MTAAQRAEALASALETIAAAHATNVEELAGGIVQRLRRNEFPTAHALQAAVSSVADRTPYADLPLTAALLRSSAFHANPLSAELTALARQSLVDQVRARLQRVLHAERLSAAKPRLAAS